MTDSMQMTVRIDSDLHARMEKCVPHGFRRHVVGSVLATVVEAIERDGPIMIGALMAGEYKLLHVASKKHE